MADSNATTMKTAVVHEYGKPLSVEERPIPEPGPGEAVFRVEAAGLCHTDIHAAHGDWPVKPGLPFVPGHEGVGIVTDVGEDVTNLEVGDRVAMPWLGYACGNCEYCVSGWETLCESQLNSGYSMDGSYGEYAKGYADYLVTVPDGVSSYDAAPLTCAGVTTYKAVKVSGAGPDDLVAVFGVGGLGHLAVQYANIAGATVVAVDLLDERLRTAEQLGAAHIINASEQDPVERIQELGGADAVISTAVSPKPFEQGFQSLKRGGTIVFVGLPAENEVSLPIFETVLKGIHVVGSIVGTRQDLREVFDLHRQGKTKVIYETRDLESVNESFEDVLQGKMQSPRLVFDFDVAEA